MQPSPGATRRELGRAAIALDHDQAFPTIHPDIVPPDSALLDQAVRSDHRGAVVTQHLLVLCGMRFFSTLAKVLPMSEGIGYA